MNVHTTQSLKRQLRFKIAQRWWRSYSSLRKGQWHYQWRLAEVCCLLVENYSNSCQVWSSRSFLQFLCGLRPNACRCFRREDRNVYTLIKLGGGHRIWLKSWILPRKYNRICILGHIHSLWKMTMDKQRCACQEHKSTRNNLANDNEYMKRSLPRTQEHKTQSCVHLKTPKKNTRTQD